MKKLFTLLVALSVFLGLCSCKRTDMSGMSSTSSEILSVQKELENIAEDETVDPENTESQLEDGAVVEMQSIHSASGQAQGIDVSKWQGKINWQKVKSSGISFAIIRIGYRGENGIIYRDANADYNIQQAQAAGVLVGVYFFSTAINETEAKEEAIWTGEAVKGYKISYPVVYDCEGYTNENSRMYGISAAKRTSNAIAFLSHIKSLGYDAMLYGAKTELENSEYWEMTKIENTYKVWVAHYSTPTYPQKQNPDYTRRYDMWQYTNRGNVDGVQGGCDMIVSYFKADERNAIDASVTPSVAEPPKTQEEQLYSEINDQVTAKQEVNLRKGAGTNFEIVATLKSGEFITRVGVGKNGWSKLLFGGQTVYAITSYLSNEVIEIQTPDVVFGMTFTPQNDSVTAKIEVNLRTLPTTDSESAGTLVSGTFLERTAISDRGWSRLKFNGQTVYAVTSYLTTEAPQITPSTQPTDATTVTEYDMTFTLTAVNVTAKEEVNLRNMPTTHGSNVVHTLKNGEYITKTGVCAASGWARLELNGQTVYCVDSFLMQ